MERWSLIYKQPGADLIFQTPIERERPVRIGNRNFTVIKNPMPYLLGDVVLGWKCINVVHYELLLIKTLGVRKAQILARGNSVEELKMRYIAESV